MSFVPGQVKIDTVSGGVVQFGGAVFVSPKNASKNAFGSGASNTGVHIITVTGTSATNNLDSDVVDQPIVNDN
ncbi:spore germination protein [Neobacillus sp. PS2-9]|uniref:spore germination protein n=1 Tax=Neobacillus sp. PS2-9 TaxID=3070676 RepID=UPI0027E0108B|nr:spore germination protein [Neobacillus sp. PS2-9]WML58898.1 spore germination protein [Neobacillus sp. PS2-9]